MRFIKLKGLTRIPFTYKTNDVARYDNVNYKAAQISVARLLDDLLKDTDLRFEQVNSNIIIKKIHSDKQEELKVRQMPHGILYLMQVFAAR